MTPISKRPRPPRSRANLRRCGTDEFLVRQSDTHATELPLSQQRIERRHASPLGEPVTLVDAQPCDALEVDGHLPRQDCRAADHVPQRRQAASRKRAVGQRGQDGRHGRKSGGAESLHE